MSVALMGANAAPAYAVESWINNGRAFNNNIPAAAPSCDQVCDLIMDGKGNRRSLFGSFGWSEADDQWCANHARGTNPAVVASPQPTPSGNPTRCNVPMLNGDPSCQEVNRRLQQCTLKNSQIETRCAAYLGYKRAKTSEKVTLGFDVAATTACGAACAGQFFGLGAALIVACQAAGVAATGNEIFQIIRARNSEVGNFITKASQGVSVGVAGLATGMAISNMATGTNAVRNGLQYTNGNVTGWQPGSPQRRNTCVAAAAFGALTGIRAFNMRGQASGRRQACDQVTELMTASLSAELAPPADAGGGAGSGPNTASLSGDGGGAGGAGGGDGFSSSSGSAAGGGAGAGGAGQGSGSSGFSGESSGSSGVYINRTPPGVLGSGNPADDYARCLADPKCDNSQFGRGGSPGSTALDGGLIAESGLGAALLPKVKGLDLDRMADFVEKGGRVGDLIGGGGSSGALGSLASAAQAGAPNLGVPLASLGGDVGSTPASGGTPMGAAAQGQDPFAGMGAPADTGLGGPNTVGYGDKGGEPGGSICDSRDIWHSSCQGVTIFEIVSSKINRSHDRVERLGYALPMNRALANQ